MQIKTYSCKLGIFWVILFGSLHLCVYRHSAKKSPRWRRHPFIFIESEEGKRLTLAVDPTSPLLSQSEGASLYEPDGKPSAAAKSALAFCRAYKAEMDRTRVLVRQIIDAGITVARRAEVTLPGGGKAAVGGFRIVDEALLAGLPDEAFLSLRKTGALTLVYCHLMSMAAWRNLLA
jgi:hypothetical protein